MVMQDIRKHIFVQANFLSWYFHHVGHFLVLWGGFKLSYQNYLGGFQWFNNVDTKNGSYPYQQRCYDWNSESPFQ